MLDIIIQFNFYNYLHYNDYFNLLNTCKYYYNYYYKLEDEEIFFNYILTSRFSNKFTIIVKPIIISYKDCFNRICKFEKILKNLGHELWEEDIYYLFWNIKYKLNKYYID